MWPDRLRTISESINAISIDQSKCPAACEYCGKSGDLRPYGTDGAWICFECGMDNAEETEKAFGDILLGKPSENIKTSIIAEAVYKMVRDLRKGDILASGIKIISDPTAGYKTPSGKVEIGVEYSDGKQKVQLWNKNTKMLVNESIDKDNNLKMFDI